jgi:dipeptidase E
MRVLLGSGGFRTRRRIDLLRRHVRAFFGRVRHLLFVPYALADHRAYLRAIRARGYNADYPVIGIERQADPVAAVGAAEALFVGGGNTFRLLAELYRLNLLEPIRERVRAGVPYLGISAGSNVACPTIKTTNDMPITQPSRLEALGLVPFQVNPHYFSGPTWVRTPAGYRRHFGETRDDRIAEFHEMNDTPVVGLCEGGLLEVTNGHAVLAGAPARVFRKGKKPVDVKPGASLDRLLMT